MVHETTYQGDGDRVLPDLENREIAGAVERLPQVVVAQSRGDDSPRTSQGKLIAVGAFRVLDQFLLHVQKTPETAAGHGRNQCPIVR